MIVSAPDFDAWRAAARMLLVANVPPADVQFEDGTSPGLFTPDKLPAAPTGGTFNVPRAFVALAEAVACHRDLRRWDHLYRALWRLTHGEPHLLDLATDDCVGWLLHAEKSVRRDIHKMHAFVRFRAVGDHFVAWHRPDHRILRRAAPFFARRFPEMGWSILTPDESVLWDGDGLRFGPGVPAKDAPAPDELEGMWKTYYRATFNPARIKIKAMKRELPVRHWPTLPEAAIIPDLLAEAPARVAAMVAHQEGCARSAADFLPETRDLDSLRAAARDCSACDMCGPDWPPVFGEGPAEARIVLVGERPSRWPAVDPLQAALGQAGLNPAAVYRTHAVKRDAGDGTRVGPREAAACRPWLLAELAAIRPAVVVCLGPAAARAVLGPLFRYAERRGEVVTGAGGVKVVATFHPNAALRADKRAEIIAHLALAQELAETHSGT
jgi:DNA polymerase